MPEFEDINDRSDRFASQPGELNVTQCIYCTRWHVGGGRSTCDAFPDGVPREIIRNDFDHREPHPGDNGLQFEAREGASYSTR